MFKKRTFIVFLIAALTGISFCRAAEKGKNKYFDDSDDDGARKTAWIELGFYSPLQVCGEDYDISAFRCALIYTNNKSVSGLDCGLVCHSGRADGLQFAWTNTCTGIVNGLTVGIFNTAGVEMNGMQVAIYNHAGSDSMDDIATKSASSSGFQWGWTNCADAVFTGLQVGIINVSTTLFKGFQIGFVNISEQPNKEFEEFQSKKFKAGENKRSCIQLGLVNYNPKGMLPITILINF